MEVGNYRTDCERVLNEVVVRLDEVVYKYGRSRCVDLMSVVMQMMEAMEYVVDYGKNMTNEKWREYGLGEIDWMGWKERLEKGLKTARRQHLSRRDNGVHSQWRDLTERGRFCAVVEGLPTAERFECEMWKEFVERYMGESDLVGYDAELETGAVKERFRLSAQPMNDMMMWMGEKLGGGLLALDGRKVRGDVDPLRKELGGEIQKVMRGLKGYRSEWAEGVWNGLLWREWEGQEERGWQEMLWQMLRADNKTKKYRRGVLKLAGLMKVIGVMVEEGVYVCDEGMVVRGIEKEEGEGVAFENQLKKYMKRGFDENSYDESQVEKWIRGVCWEARSGRK